MLRNFARVFSMPINPALSIPYTNCAKTPNILAICLIGDQINLRISFITSEMEWKLNTY